MEQKNQTAAPPTTPPTTPPAMVGNSHYADMVRHDGWALHAVPMAHRTPEIYELAMRNITSAFMFFPDDVKTRAMCEKAVGKDAGMILYIPKKFLDREMSVIAVTRDKRAIGDIPEEYRDYEMSLFAVKGAYSAIMSVPDNVVDEKICAAVIMNDGNAYQHVPRRFKTLDLFKKMVERYGELALNYLYERDQTFDKCMYSIQMYPKSQRFVLNPRGFLTWQKEQADRIERAERAKQARPDPVAAGEE